MTNSALTIDPPDVVLPRGRGNIGSTTTASIHALLRGARVIPSWFCAECGGRHSSGVVSGWHGRYCYCPGSSTNYASLYR